MKYTLKILNLLLIIFIFYSGLFSSYLHVSINDPIYDYLQRMSIQGVLPNYMNSTLPLSRDYIADMLILLSEKRDKLSRVDNKILDRYLAYVFSINTYNAKTTLNPDQYLCLFFPFSEAHGDNLTLLIWKQIHQLEKLLLSHIPYQANHGLTRHGD